MKGGEDGNDAHVKFYYLVHYLTGSFLPILSSPSRSESSRGLSVVDSCRLCTYGMYSCFDEVCVQAGTSEVVTTADQRSRTGADDMDRDVRQG